METAAEVDRRPGGAAAGGTAADVEDGPGVGIAAGLEYRRRGPPGRRAAPPRAALHKGGARARIFPQAQGRRRIGRHGTQPQQQREKDER